MTDSRPQSSTSRTSRAMRLLKPYMTVWVLGAAAAFLGGASWLDFGRGLTGPAALLFTGSAVTRLLDVRQQQKDANADEFKRRRAGLSDTRRLLYAIKWNVGEPPSDVLASALDGLINHAQRTEPEDNLAHRLMRCGRTAGNDELRQWLTSVIDDITAKIVACDNT